MQTRLSTHPDTSGVSISVLAPSRRWSPRSDRTDCYSFPDGRSDEAVPCRRRSSRFREARRRCTYVVRLPGCEPGRPPDRPGPFECDARVYLARSRQRGRTTRFPKGTTNATAIGVHHPAGCYGLRAAELDVDPVAVSDALRSRAGAIDRGNSVRRQSNICPDAAPVFWGFGSRPHPWRRCGPRPSDSGVPYARRPSGCPAAPWRRSPPELRRQPRAFRSAARSATLRGDGGAHPAVGSPSRHRATSPQSEMDGIWLETGCDTTWTGNRGPEEWR